MKNSQFLIVIGLILAAAFGVYKWQVHMEVKRKARVNTANQQLVSNFESYGGGF
ncbi:hypothetical protein [Aliamphritea ceti]|uniref:hypothetical protein n=1 Tax=Aliamphritea ceti TaxID=1524258 RepID=UPI0021C27C06|nr:hypothetical protein [Aliamphritea ceti]